ncbi:MAG: 50S ribosomal protein L29 [Pseudomonadota bacterium]
MKAADLRDMSTSALEEELLKLRREQFNLRMQKATGQEMQMHDFRRVRRDIARIKTIMSQASASDA